MYIKRAMIDSTDCPRASFTLSATHRKNRRKKNRRKKNRRKKNNETTPRNFKQQRSAAEFPVKTA